MLSSTQENDGAIRLPKHLGSRNLNGLFSLCGQIHAANGPIVLNGEDLAFVDPLGIAVLGALLEPLRETRPATIEWLSVDVGTYLDRMDVLTRCGIQGVESRCVVRHNRHDRLVELTSVSNAHEVDEAAERLAVALARTLTSHKPDAPRDPETGRNDFDSFCYPLSYVLRELLLNALSHARKEGRGDAAVWVAAQYFDKKGQVQLAVVDNGCGILSTLLNSPDLRIKDHVNAIPTALRPFVSCNPDLGLPGGTANQGVGLTTTNNIAKATQGGLHIISGNAAALTESGERAFAMNDGAFWPGVAVMMTCKRASLPSVNIRELLPVVRDAPKFDLRFAP
jgi:hypothetical protein